MTKTQILNLLKTTSGVLTGAGLHHYGSKVLDSNNAQIESQIQAARDDQIDKMSYNVHKLVDRADKLDNSIIVPKQDVEIINETLNSMKEDPSIVENGIKLIEKIIDSWSKGNNYISKISFQDIYDYLDSLTLLQESAFIHICMFIYILCCIYIIMAAFFGNEIIKYLNLEEKYPKLSIFFKLRTKFQRYYLVWNIVGIIIICILGVGINLLVLVYK